MFACSAHAKLPVNVDLEMTFPVKDGMQSYKPHFELPSDGPALPSPADTRAAKGMLTVSSHSKDSRLIVVSLLYGLVLAC